MPIHGVQELLVRGSGAVCDAGRRGLGERTRRDQDTSRRGGRAVDPRAA